MAAPDDATTTTTRYLRRVQTGDWLDWTYTWSGGDPIDAEAHVQQLADALGIDPSELEVVEVQDGDDPRSGGVVPIPQEPQAAQPLGPVGALAALLAATGVLTPADAASAVQLTEQALSNEALAWSLSADPD